MIFHIFDAIKRQLRKINRAFIVQLVRHHGIVLILNNGTIGVLAADVADSCAKRPRRSLNHLLLQRLNLDPVLAVLSLVEFRQATFHGLTKEVPRSSRLQSCHREEVVRASAIDEELEGEGWMKA